MGMLLTDPPVLPAFSSTSSNLTSSQPANVTYNTTSSTSSPGPKLWDMKMFGYLSGSLLFGTIIMPLISGTLLRSVVKTYTKLVPWFHLASALLGLLCLVFLDVFPEFLGDTFKKSFDAAVVVVAILITYFAFLEGAGRMANTCFLVAIVLCFMFDWYVSSPISLAATVAWLALVGTYLYKYGRGWWMRKLEQMKIKRRTA